jgi:hypothetical protein
METSSMNAAQIALQIGPQTTLFINPEVLTDFFQKASSAQRWAPQAQLIKFATRREMFNRDERRLSKEVGWIDQVDKKAHELGARAQSGLAHALWERASYPRRVAAALGDAALKISKPATPDSDLQKIGSLTEKAQRSTALLHKCIGKQPKFCVTTYPPLEAFLSSSFYSTLLILHKFSLSG